MSTLQQLLGKEDKFFDLFEASAAECRQSVNGLVSIVQQPSDHPTLEPITAARRKDKSIHNQLNEELCFTVVTSLERGDILSLAHSLYKIPKTVEKIGERILLSPTDLEGFSLTEQLNMLQQCTDTLLTMVQALRKNVHLQEIRALNDRLQSIEGEADKLVLDCLRALYASEMEGRRVVYLKDIFELLERVTDRCRDAGNVIVQIALKNS